MKGVIKHDFKEGGYTKGDGIHMFSLFLTKACHKLFVQCYYQLVNCSQSSQIQWTIYSKDTAACKLICKEGLHAKKSADKTMYGLSIFHRIPNVMK